MLWQYVVGAPGNDCIISLTVITLPLLFPPWYPVADVNSSIYRREQFLQWADNLLDQQTPAWLGLPSNAEKLLLTNQGTYVIRYA